MANRSYLYSVDAAPTKKKNPWPIRGISEFNWGIPLAHELLASGRPRVCASAIWKEHRIGVVARYDRGVEALLGFLETLGASGKPKDAPAFAESVAKTKRFLASKKNRGELFLLEAGEIFDLAGGDLAESARRLVADEIPASAARAAAAAAGREKKWLAELRETWQEKLGIGWWSEVLYFSFPRSRP
jgi:hypothetical protein